MKLVKDYTLDSNFWELNPQLAKMGPFADLYRADKSRGKRKSSDIAWGVFMYCENSERSLFFRLDEQNKRKEIERNFGVDFRGKRINECIDFYNENCISSTEKLLLQYHEFLERRTDFILTAEYDIDSSEKLDRAASQTKKIWDEYKKILDQFKEEENMSRVEGGRILSPHEKGEI